MGRNIFIINCMLAVAVIAGCIPTVEYTKQVNLSVPAGQAEFLAAETHNGDITITGCQTTDCNLTATIIAKADTEENAKKIAEQVKISLVPEGNNINVRIEKPDIPKEAQIGVSLNVNLPTGMNLSLVSHNGNIHSSDITGRVKAVTHNGNVIITNASGGAETSTHNGNIDYTGTLANLKFDTHNGNVDIRCIKQSSKPCNISSETHNGCIDFAAPENFSATVDVSTHNGSIYSSLPITVTGEIDKNLKGTIGGGRDKLHLETHNGSIKIK